MDYVDWQEASDTLSIAEHGICVSSGRPYRLIVDGRIAGRFSTLRGAQDEETRLHRLAMKDGRQIASAIESN
jgi:hypothetical protein